MCSNANILYTVSMMNPDQYANFARDAASITSWCDAVIDCAEQHTNAIMAFTANESTLNVSIRNNILCDLWVRQHVHCLVCPADCARSVAEFFFFKYAVSPV